MNRCYQIKARPFWNHIQTASSFAGNALSLGSLVLALICIPTLWQQPELLLQALSVIGLSFVTGLILEGLGLIKHNYDLNRTENEGGASHYVQNTTFGKTYILRNCLIGFNIIAASALLLLTQLSIEPVILIILWAILMLINVLTAAIGRALFYILVIPTTMPGAFFWKNKGFEQHARDIGLADNPNSGVVHLQH